VDNLSQYSIELAPGRPKTHQLNLHFLGMKFSKKILAYRFAQKNKNPPAAKKQSSKKQG
jgi:hypothetical protein